MIPFYCDGIAISLHSSEPQQGQWVHLLPSGKFDGRDGRGPFIVSNLKDIIQNSADYAGGNGIPVDYDHQIDHAKANGKPAIAAGWIKQLEARKDGIWGLVSWTEKAAAHIAAKEYRFLSPVIGVEKQNGGAVNVIMRAAITNNPNLTQLKAIAAMETQIMDKFLQKILAALKLPVEATEDDILDKLGEVVGQASTSTEPLRAESPTPGQKQFEKPDASKWVSMADFEKVVAELNRVNQGIEKHAAEIHVADEIQAGRLPPYLRNWGIELCTANKPAFDGFVDRTKRNWEPLFKRMLSAEPPNNDGAQLSENERDAASRMNLTHEEFARAKRDNNS